jgi:phage terminase large subunit-like protein
MSEEVKYRKSRKLFYYVPYDKQLEFHTSGVPTRAIFGGNRSGKTTCGGMEFLFHMTGQYPKWYPEDQRVKGAIKGRIIGKDFQKGIGEVIIPFLDEWLDESLVAKKYKNPIGVPVKWTLKNGSVFDILSHEQNTEQFEGWKGHVAWFDEPPPRDKYIATLRGLVDFRGRNWLTLTPLTQPWIYDDIYTNSDADRVHCVTVDMRDNPHLNEAAIKEFESSLTEEEKEARLHGRFLHLSGLVYKEFNPNDHIVDAFDIPPLWTRYFAIDPHERTPTACLWLAVDPKGNHWIYDEIWLGDMDLRSIAYAIQAQEGEDKPRIRLIDPHNDKDNMITGGFNVRKELMKYGIFCERANSDTQLGKSRIRKALKPMYHPLSKSVHPQLRVFRHCKQTIYEFQHYLWDNYKRNAEDYGLKDQVKKKDDHLMDCLRYIYNFDPRFFTPESEMEEEEVEYTGKYTKYPVKSAPRGSYHSLVEGQQEHHGAF